MSRVYSDTVLPEDSGVSQDFTFGTTGDTVQVTSGATLKVNTLKDSGGNTLFTSDGSGTLSSVNSAFAGSPTLITTNTSSGAASSDFTANIDSTYKLYIFKFNEMNPATDDVDFTFQVNASGQSGYNEEIVSALYRAKHYEGAAEDLAFEATPSQQSGTAIQPLMQGVGGGADESVSGTLYIFNPSGTTFVKCFYSEVQGYHQNDGSFNTFVSGYFNITAALTNVQFKMSSGNMDGTITMYGI